MAVAYVGPAEYPHLAGVELGSAGMEWPASVPFSPTVEDLADVVVAANEDPHIQVPRIKLGHYSEVNGELRVVDPFEALGDAAPAFGRVVNLRTVNDGAVLVGDFVEVPEWLAQAMPSAYPNRSGEWRWDVETPGGKRYRLVLTAVALLGLELPAVADLEDLERLLTEGPDLAATTAATRTREVRFVVETSVSVEVVRRRFNFEWATDPDSVFEGPDGPVSPYWWWARDIRVDPNEVIADDDEGNLWRVPFSTDGEDEVTFGQPVRVRETYVDVTEGDAVAASAPPIKGQRVLASNLARPRKAAPKDTAASRPRHEEVSMSTIDIAALRSRLQLSEDELPDDATVEQINEVLAAEPEAAEPEGEAPAEEPAEEREPEPVAASANAETVTVSRQVWEEQQRRLEQVEAAERERTERETRARRDEIVASAVREGRIAPSERDHYRQLLDVDEQRTSQLLSSLAAGRVPVDERGATETEAGNDAEYEQIMAGAFGVQVRKES